MPDLTPVSLLLVVGLSFGICVLATSLAVESMALFLPAFLIVFPATVPGFPAISGNEAIGLTLIIMFFGQSSTLVGYWYRGQIDARLWKPILVLTLPTAVIGRAVGFLLPEQALLLVFAGLLFGLAAVVGAAQLRDRHHHHASGARNAVNGDRFSPLERGSFLAGGLVAGLIGFAIGELTNTILHVRHQLPIQRSTGTSTLVLYLTLVTANVTNLVIVFLAPSAIVGSVAIPWSIAAIIAPVVVIGGQVGAYMNNRLPEWVVVRLLIGTYVLVGLVTLLRTVS